MKNKLFYILEWADNTLILGQRLSEWCGHGPVIEQDIALTNIALDHLGCARNLYAYAAELFNGMDAVDKSECFASVAFQRNLAEGHQADEDDMAFLRDAWDFRNVLLVEQPNTDWAYTGARGFLFDAFNFHFLSAMCNSVDERLAAIASKSLKEATYHLRWSSEWVIRLGDGTAESKARITDAVAALWPFTGELFMPTAVDDIVMGLGVDFAALKPLWLQKVTEVFDEATLEVPTGIWMQTGGKTGTHSENLGFVLAEMQFMQRAYPNMEW